MTNATIPTKDARPQPGDTIVVWFSCGAASATALMKTIELYPECHVRAVNNPVVNEDPDNWRFLADVSEWLGVDIEFATHRDYPTADCEQVWEDRQYMAGNKGAPCTLKLKKEARQQWENRNHHDWLVLGFTADEEKRQRSFELTERDNALGVLVKAGITKRDCYEIIAAAGVDLPRMYHWGYPNANCIGCVKATSPTYWNHVRKMHPEVFQRRAEMSRRIGAKLVRHKGERIYLDELPEDAQGRPMKSMDIECGTFCEEGTER